MSPVPTLTSLLLSSCLSGTFRHAGYYARSFTGCFHFFHLPFLVSHFQTPPFSTTCLIVGAPPPSCLLHVYMLHVRSVLHMLFVCFKHTAHTPSLHVHASHLHVHTLVFCCLLHTKKQKRAPWCKHFASVSHAHGEALLRATSYHRRSISRFEEEAELTEEDEQDYQLPSCVTVKT